MPAYVTLDDMKRWVGIPVADTTDDATLSIALDAAELQVNRYAGNRRFVADANPVVRHYSVDAATWVVIDPLQTTTGLVVETDENGDGTFETAWTLDTDFYLGPYNAAANALPWNQLLAVGDNRFPVGTRRIRVTARFGTTTAPADVALAVRIQAAFLWKRKDSTQGVLGSPEFGNEMRVQASLDPTARMLLRDYRIPWVVSA